MLELFVDLILGCESLKSEDLKLFGAGKSPWWMQWAIVLVVGEEQGADAPGVLTSSGVA